MLAFAAIAPLGGCASNDPADENSTYVEYDPLEPLNRKIHAFNMGLDKAVLRPVARGYRKVVPSPVRRSVTNFFSNLTTPRSALNNFLQGKPGRGFNELGRFLFNSTLGIGGLFDVAGAAGMERYDENFSETIITLMSGPTMTTRRYETRCGPSASSTCVIVCLQPTRYSKTRKIPT
jgi:phospholipid-binding lipoprotein MlaA